MPRVPTYERQVGLQQLPSARLTDAAPSLAPLGQAFQNVGNAANELYLKERTKAEEGIAEEIDNQLFYRQKALLSDPTSGALLKKGRDAIGLSDSVLAEFDKQSGETEKLATSDRLKAVHRRLANNRRQQLATSLLAHENEQGLAYRKTQDQAAADAALDEMIYAYREPERQDAAMLKGEQAIIALNEGASPEAVAAQVKRYRTEGNLGVVNRLLTDGRTADAQALVDAKRQDFTAEGLVRVDGLLKEGSIRSDSARFTDEIFASSQNETEALKRARSEIGDVETQDETVRRLKIRYDEATASRTERERRLTEAAWNRALPGSTNPAVGRTDFPPEEWNALPSDTKKNLLRYWTDSASGKDRSSNPVTYYALDQLSLSDPDSAEHELLTRINELSESDFQTLSGKIRSARNEAMNREFKVLDDIREQATLEIFGKRKVKSEQAYTFRRRFDEAITTERERTRQAVGALQAEKIKKDLTTEFVVREGIIFDVDRPLYKITIDDVPEQERALIENSLRQERRSVTEQAIVELYVKALKRD